MSSVFVSLGCCRGQSLISVSTNGTSSEGTAHKTPRNYSCWFYRCNEAHHLGRFGIQTRSWQKLQDPSLIHKTLPKCKINYLSKQTTISQIPDIINCAPAIDSDVIIKEGKITQEGLTVSYLCDNCKSKVDFSNQKFVRCQSCKLKMTKESLHRSNQRNLFRLDMKNTNSLFFLQSC